MICHHLIVKAIWNGLSALHAHTVCVGFLALCPFDSLPHAPNARTPGKPMGTRVTASRPHCPQVPLMSLSAWTQRHVRTWTWILIPLYRGNPSHTHTKGSSQSNKTETLDLRCLEWEKEEVFGCHWLLSPSPPQLLERRVSCHSVHRCQDARREDWMGPKLTSRKWVANLL